MRLLFAGTPDFAAASLSALLAGKHEVVAVLTQPDRPAGRGRQLVASPVKQLATTAGLSVLQPTTLKTPQIQATLSDLKPDLMIVVAYGLILPPAVLSLPRLGCINVHASLLPRWRGAAPIQRAIAAGDASTGITIMQMDAGLDTGDMLLRVETPILPDDTGGGLHDRLADMGAAALLEVLGRLPADGTPQNNQDSCYAPKLTKEEALIDWRRPAIELHNLIRAFNPWPVAHTTLAGQALRIWRSHPAKGTGTPGEILRSDDQRLLIACGEGALELLEIQLPGKKVLSVVEVLRGQARLFEAGTLLGG